MVGAWIAFVSSVTCYIPSTLDYYKLHNIRDPYAYTKINMNMVCVIRSSKMSLKSKIFVFCFFWHFPLGYYLSFNLVKIPWILDNRFLRNSSLSDCKNKTKKKQQKTKKLSALFGYIFQLLFASSNSFCLIASHITSETQIKEDVYMKLSVVIFQNPVALHFMNWAW